MEKKYFAQLDGVRALAALLVVASHTGAMKMTGQGGLAVAAFFALSGFIVVCPWKKDEEERFCSIKYIGQFYLKRALRLLPAYYVVIIFANWLTGTLRTATEDLLFLNSSGHLWFLQQELLMYLIVPFLMIVLHFLKQRCRMNNLLIGILLLITAYFLQEHLTSKVFYLMGNGKKQSFRIGLFMTGMAFGYFYKWGKCSKITHGAAKAAADVLEFVLAAAAVFSSAFFVEKLCPGLTEYYVGWKHPFACAVGSSLLFYLLLANGDGWAARIFSNPIAVYVGRLSYGIYLIHYFLIPYVTLPTCKQIFAAVFVLSLGTSLLINEIIEKPLARLTARAPKHS